MSSGNWCSCSAFKHIVHLILFFLLIQANDKKEETSMKLHTLDSSDNIEGIGQQIQGVPSEGTTKKPKKIKF